MSSKRTTAGRRWLGTTAAAAATLLALAAAGCSASATGSSSKGSGQKLTIGFVTPGSDDTFFNSVTSGAQAAGSKLQNAKVVVGTGPGGGNYAGMVPVIQNMYARGVNAIVVPGLPQVTDALQRFKSAHIPIIFYADGIPGSSLPASTVNTNSIHGGELAGAYIKNQLHGRGTLAIIEYPKGEYPTIDTRVTGVVDGLKGSQIKVDYLDAGCDSEAKDVAAAQNELTRDPNLSAIFGECAQAILGAEAGVKQAKIAPSKILMTGFDAKTAEIQAIIAGTENATVAQYPAKMGQLAVQTADKAAKGQTVPAEIDPGTLLITKADAVQALHQTR